MSFFAATQLAKAGDFRFEWDVPDQWQQGRGAFGGLVLAALSRAMESVVGAPTRSLRSLTGVISAPVLVGRASIEVEMMRAGSGLSTLTAKLVQDGELRAHSVGVFAEPRAIAHNGWSRGVGPGTKRPLEMPEIPVAPPLGPVFAAKIDFRSTGAYPYTSSSEPVEGWVRFREDDSIIDSSAIIGLMDSYWPCALVREAGPRPMATVSFALEMATLPQNMRANEYVYYRAHSDFCRDGYSIEFRELWSERGELLALNQQIFVVIK